MTASFDYRGGAARKRVDELFYGLLAAMEDPPASWQGFRARYPCEARLDCTWVAAGEEGGLTVAPPMLRRMAALELGLQVRFLPSTTWGPYVGEH